jgi:phosphatidate cytidylyltransferase
LLPVALFCIWMGGYAYLLLVAAGCVLAAHEWVTLCGYSATDPRVLWIPAVVAVAAVCSGTGLAGLGLLLVVAGAAAALVLVPRYGVPPAMRPTRHRLALAFGVPYLGMTAVALPWLRDDPVEGLANTVFILFLIWAADVGAYLLGRLVGGPKLAPAISPGKTWSGTIGGLAAAALTGLATAACLSTGYSASHGIGLAIVLGIISQAGDLLESGLKRHFGVKDSGRIIPGHGGLLDRLDSLLAVAPAAALLALTVGRGVVLWR